MISPSAASGFGEWPHCAGELQQRYDFSCGELHSTFRAELDGTVLDVDVVTFASRSHPALVLQEVTVTASRACELTLTAVVSTAGVPGRVERRLVGVESPDGGELADGLLCFEPVGGMSGSGVALWTEVRGGDAARERADWWGNGDLSTVYRIDTRRGRTYRLRQVAAMVPSSMHSIADHHAVRLLRSGVELGFDELRRRNRALWDELWRGRLVLLGADAVLAGPCRRRVLLPAVIGARLRARPARASSVSPSGATTTTTTGT